MPDIIFRYFPSLSSIQKDRISRLKPVYELWNSKINVISRKDITNFYLRHVLHSLSIAKAVRFLPGTSVLDVGTGGGFPGIPLAILFPGSVITLLDSIQKKIKVATAVAEELELDNVRHITKRVEDEKGKYDFVISRSVMKFQQLIKLTAKNVLQSGNNSIENGILCLKGGDLESELGCLRDRVHIWDIGEFFPEPFFETKKLVYLSHRFLQKFPQ